MENFDLLHLLADVATSEWETLHNEKSGSTSSSEAGGPLSEEDDGDSWAQQQYANAYVRRVPPARRVVRVHKTSESQVVTRSAARERRGKERASEELPDLNLPIAEVLQEEIKSILSKAKCTTEDCDIRQFFHKTALDLERKFDIPKHYRKELKNLVRQQYKQFHHSR